MGYPEEVAAHIFEKTDVAKVHFIPKCVALPKIILMPVGSYELKMPAIQEKAFIRVETESADAKSLSPGIYQRPFLV